MCSATISDVTDRVTKAAAGKTGQDFVKARDAEIAAVEKQGCAGKRRQIPVPGRHALSGRPVQALYLSQIYRCAAGVRAGRDDRLLRRRSGQFQFSPLRPRLLLRAALRRRQARQDAGSSDLERRRRPRMASRFSCAGNPGSTQRLLTAEQLESLRDLTLPETLIQFSELRGRLIRFTEESAEHARIANDLLFGIENSFKAYHGEEKALVDPALIAAKRAADNDLKAKVAANRHAGRRDRRSLERHRQGPGRVSRALSSLLHDGGARRHRLGSFPLRPHPGARGGGEGQTQWRPPARIYRQPAGLAEQDASRSRSRSIPSWSRWRWNSGCPNCAKISPPTRRGTKIFLGKDSPEDLSARLAQSKLGDPAVRKALWDGGMAAIQASDDPMIKFVLATDAASRAMRKQYEERVSGPTDRAAQKIAARPFRDLRHQRLSGRDVHACGSPTARSKAGRDNGVDRAALHLLQGPVGARHRPVSLRPGAALADGASQGQSRTRCSISSATTTLSAAIPARP